VILTALVLFCCTALPADDSRTPAAPASTGSTATGSSSTGASADASKPDAPTPKMIAASASKADPLSGAESTAAPIQPAAKSPVKPAIGESYETAKQRKIWYALMVLDHGTAAFDAWTTRRAISGGYGVEGDPLQRPFAHSGAIYATTQVTPVVMDLLAHSMMRSSHPIIRKAWWIPQTASASVSLGAGIHNYSMVP
jgi:hypothetical protein